MLSRGINLRRRPFFACTSHPAGPKPRSDASISRIRKLCGFIRRMQPCQFVSRLMVNSRPPWPNEAVVEIQLLLPALQAKLLDDLAYARGKSLGRLVRDLLQDYLAQQGSHPSPGPGDLPGVSEPGKSRLAE